MHARVISVSFPCVDLKNKGSPDPSKCQIEANESSRFFVYIGEYHLKLTTNQIINQRSVPKIRQRVGKENHKYYVIC